MSDLSGNPQFPPSLDHSRSDQQYAPWQPKYIYKDKPGGGCIGGLLGFAIFLAIAGAAAGLAAVALSGVFYSVIEFAKAPLGMSPLISPAAALVIGSLLALGGVISIKRKRKDGKPQKLLVKAVKIALTIAFAAYAIVSGITLIRKPHRHYWADTAKPVPELKITMTTPSSANATGMAGKIFCYDQSLYSHAARLISSRTSGRQAGKGSAALKLGCV
jgi:hypothetical protein